MSSFILKYSKVAFLYLIISTNCTSQIYSVGPAQALNELNDVPWLALKAGDTVEIHYRLEPYRTKIGLSAIGTKEQPIHIKGISNDEGKKPILSGENAITPENLTNFFSEEWDEANALILIKRGKNLRWGEKPANIIIENLHLTGASSNNQFTDQYNNTRTYDNSSAAVWANLVDTLTIKDCTIEDNGNGVFVLSKNSEEDVSRNITITGNTFNSNGVADSFRQHHIYTQAAGITIESNSFEHLRPLAQGAAIKDRSSGTVIRYNKIIAGTYAIDLVDPEDSYKIITKEENFHDTWVYGNIIISATNNGDLPFSSRLIHYGGDTGVFDIYRKGTLHFFHNTVYTDLYSQHETLPRSWRTRLFIMDTNDETVNASNNIFYANGNSYVSWLSEYGNMVLSGTNWMNSATAVYSDNVQEFKGSYTNDGILIQGSDISFLDKSSYQLSIIAASSAIDSATLSATNDNENFPVSYQYSDTLQLISREAIGNALDLGALESDVSGGTGDDNDIIIDPNNTDTWPIAEQGNFTQAVNGIESVYPAPFSRTTLDSRIMLEFTSNTDFTWTANRYITIYDNNANIIANFDIEPGDTREGLKTIEVSFQELGIEEVGVYYVKLDSGFVKLQLTPWRNGPVSEGQWYFAIVE